MKSTATSMVITLTHEDRVLIKINIWYLMLSAILRSDPPFYLNQALKESKLTALVRIVDQDIIFEIPQPPEFIDDSEENR